MLKPPDGVALLDLHPAAAGYGEFFVAEPSPRQPTGPDHSRVLMGRDLSPLGMRVESSPDLCVGDRFRLALYGPGRGEPYVVRAEILRDDQRGGLYLGFQDVPAEIAGELEKLVACLPDVESLEGEESDALGAIISEIVASD